MRRRDFLTMIGVGAVAGVVEVKAAEVLPQCMATEYRIYDPYSDKIMWKSMDCLAPTDCLVVSPTTGKPRPRIVKG